LNNDEWIAFYAGSTTIAIEITPSNCFGNGNNIGMQGGIYKNCVSQPMDLQCICTENPFTLVSTAFVVGEIYYLVLDGCAGDLCDYTVDVTQGSTVAPVPPPPGLILGTGTACGTEISEFSIGQLAGVSNYTWTLTPNTAGDIIGLNSNEIQVEWSNDFSGQASLCVQVANQCFTNPEIRCKTIDIRPTPSATISGGGNTCVGGSVDLVITFTGVGPWGFTPMLNGAPQGPIETSDNPYILTVTQPGNWQVLGVYQAELGCIGSSSGSAQVISGDLTLSATVTHANCGPNTGAIDLSIHDAGGPLTIQWSNNATTEDLSMLAAGTYTVIVRDSIGCTGILTAVVLDQSPIDSIVFCAGESVSIGGQIYTEPGIVFDTLVGSPGCDTIIKYVLTQEPRPTRSETVEFCPGDGVQIGGQLYTQPGIVLDTLPATTGCDTFVTYTLVQLTQPTRSQTIKLCPGESVVLGGQTYTQSGQVVLTVPAPSGCDSIITYTLEPHLPAPSTVSLSCPSNISLIADPGTAPLIVNYNQPTAGSDCPCPGISLELTAGLPSGAAFPSATTNVCYKATDACGHSATCCFTVIVREVQPCDIKVNGCIRYELLSITADPAKNLTYRIKVVNNCPNKLIYTAIQLPDAVPAMAPPHLSVFTSEEGNQYEVRNPNYSPFYSIRFKSLDDSISGGESAILKYTLPAQSEPDYILITSRLLPQIFLDAHLNTFYCPIGVTKPGNRNSSGVEEFKETSLYPNPTDGSIWVELGNSFNAFGKWRIFNSQNQKVLNGEFDGSDKILEINLPADLSNGLYFMELLNESGKRETLRFLKHN
jgi:hypothetical protein